MNRIPILLGEHIPAHKDSLTLNGSVSVSDVCVLQMVPVVSKNQ